MEKSSGMKTFCGNDANEVECSSVCHAGAVKSWSFSFVGTFFQFPALGQLEDVLFCRMNRGTRTLGTPGARILRIWMKGRRFSSPPPGNWKCLVLFYAKSWPGTNFLLLWEAMMASKRSFWVGSDLFIIFKRFEDTVETFEKFVFIRNQILIKLFLYPHENNCREFPSAFYHLLPMPPVTVT